MKSIILKLSVLVKRIGLCGPYYTLSYKDDSQCGY